MDEKADQTLTLNGVSGVCVDCRKYEHSFVDGRWSIFLRGKLYLPHESENLSLRTPTVYPSFDAYSPP